MHNNYPAIGIRWSKTIQHRNRVQWGPYCQQGTKPFAHNFGCAGCTKLIPARLDEPMFLIREGEHRYPLTLQQVNRLLKQWSKATGLASTFTLTGHCMRRGGLNWAHDAKLTGETLKVMGGWNSDAYLRYIDLKFDKRVQAGKRMVKFADKKLSGHDINRSNI